ncbi:MAG: hypothetical protein IPN69_20810 [Acidobacteria bacterium]|nr:hypothetical protein [Acidobacteriota bacterium]
MTKQLILEGLWFPNFGSDNSKKNFRLVYFITLEVDKVDDKDKPVVGADGKNVKQNVTVMVEKPKTKDFWHWRKETENLYLPPKDKKTDPVELDLSRLRTNSFGFQADNYRIESLPGTLLSVRVQIYDIHDKNFGYYLRKVLIAVGSDAIKLAGGAVGLPSGVVDLIAKGAMVFLGDGKAASDKIDQKDAEKTTKDKILFGGFSDYKAGDASIVIEGERFWGDGKIGTYRLKLGFE